jgi:sigma-E factor negative regulatory protein RseC
MTAPDKEMCVKMQQTAVVQSVDGNEAWVLGVRESSCSSCAGKASCATLGSWNTKPVKMRVRNPVGATVGDEVVVEVPDRFVLQATWRLYGRPMVVFLLVGLLCRQLAVAAGIHAVDALAACGGITSMVAYYLLGQRRWLLPQGDDVAAWEPCIVSIHKHGRGMRLVP